MICCTDCENPRVNMKARTATDHHFFVSIERGAWGAPDRWTDAGCVFMMAGSCLVFRLYMRQRGAKTIRRLKDIFEGAGRRRGPVFVGLRHGKAGARERVGVERESVERREAVAVVGGAGLTISAQSWV